MDAKGQSLSKVGGKMNCALPHFAASALPQTSRNAVSCSGVTVWTQELPGRVLVLPSLKWVLIFPGGQNPPLQKQALLPLVGFVTSRGRLYGFFW